MWNIYSLKTKPQKKTNNSIKALQFNDHVAEAQFMCDYCSKLVTTPLIPRKEAGAQKTKK